MVEKAVFGQQFPKGNFGDLHVHSGYTSGGLALDGRLQPHQLVNLAEERGLNFVAITDHDTIASAAVGKEFGLKQGYNVEVVIGSEVSSSDGHILAYNLSDNIPFWMSADETVRAIHRQGGYAVAAHPFYRLTASVGEKGLRKVAENDDPEIYWDGIEVFNASANDARGLEWISRISDGNRRARSFYRKEGENGLYGVPIGGSDTHGDGVGRVVTVVPKGMSIYEAFRAQTAGVIITDGKESYSFGGLREMNRKSKALEVWRRSLPEGLRKFPSVTLPQEQILFSASE